MAIIIGKNNTIKSAQCNLSNTMLSKKDDNKSKQYYISYRITLVNTLTVAGITQQERTVILNAYDAFLATHTTNSTQVPKLNASGIIALTNFHTTYIVPLNLCTRFPDKTITSRG
jgi:hypothetical protein